jgi:hypothetical protein
LLGGTTTLHSMPLKRLRAGHTACNGGGSLTRLVAFCMCTTLKKNVLCMHVRACCSVLTTCDERTLKGKKKKERILFPHCKLLVVCPAPLITAAGGQGLAGKEGSLQNFLSAPLLIVFKVETKISTLRSLLHPHKANQRTARRRAFEEHL